MTFLTIITSAAPNIAGIFDARRALMRKYVRVHQLQLPDVDVEQISIRYLTR
jgi:hypothetical protein